MLTVEQTDLPSLTPVTFLHVPELYLRPSGDRKGRQNNRKGHQELAQQYNKTKSVQCFYLVMQINTLNPCHCGTKPEATMYTKYEDTCLLCGPILLTS